MTHDEAQREMYVERYLLEELEGDARAEFEDHLFDCTICAADLRSGVEFTESLKAEAPAPGLKLVPKTSPLAPDSYQTPGWRERTAAWAVPLLGPWVMVPALALCLFVIGVQVFVTQSRLHRELALAETPSVVSGLQIHGATRGLGTSAVTAHTGGGFLLSLDVPAQPQFRAYLCTLVSPSGKPVWHTYLSPEQANDTVVIHVPVGSTAAGTNVLKVEGIPQTQGSPMVSLLQRRFDLKIMR